MLLFSVQSAPWNEITSELETLLLGPKGVPISQVLLYVDCGIQCHADRWFVECHSAVGIITPASHSILPDFDLPTFCQDYLDPAYSETCEIRTAVRQARVCVCVGGGWGGEGVEMPLYITVRGWKLLSWNKFTSLLSVWPRPVDLLRTPQTMSVQ
jgi:hypothetical protein